MTAHGLHRAAGEPSKVTRSRRPAVMQEDKHLNVRKAKRATGIVIVVRFVETVTAGRAFE
jgi:hypothetical protein